MASLNNDNAPSGSSPPAETQGSRNVSTGLLTLGAVAMTTTEDSGPSVRTLAAAATTSTAITPAGGSSEPTARSPTQDSSRDGSNDRSSGTARRQINIPPTLVHLLQADTEDIVN